MDIDHQTSIILHPALVLELQNHSIQPTSVRVVVDEDDFFEDVLWRSLYDRMDRMQQGGDVLVSLKRQHHTQ